MRGFFIKAEAVVTLGHDAGLAVSISCYREKGFAVMLDHHSGRLRQKAFGKNDPQQIGIELPIVRGIEKHDIRLKTLARQSAQRGKHILLDDAIPFRYSTGMKILLNQPDRSFRAFNEYRFACAATQRLYSNRSRSAEDVQHCSAVESGSDDIEQTFFQPVSRGTQFQPFRPLESSSFELSGYHSHFLPRYGRPEMVFPLLPDHKRRAAAVVIGARVQDLQESIRLRPGNFESFPVAN
jgi:hypothetical protein